MAETSWSREFGRLLAGLLFLASGCGKLPDPGLARQWLLQEEPQGAVTIEEARKSLDERPEVVLIGRVGARDWAEWWFPASATLVVSEGFPGSEYNVSPDHDPSTCPFCKWKWKQEDSYALIRLVDLQGEKISADIPKLLGLRNEDFIVVRGDGKLDESGILTVTTNGLFIRPKP